nr:MAG TPA: hypothetical protein [Caudoviricetes sp.]
MSKKKPLKILFGKTCPNCGEKYCRYITKNGNEKGLWLNGVLRESFFIIHRFDKYHCYTCGYEWEEKSL